MVVAAGCGGGGLLVPVYIILVFLVFSVVEVEVIRKVGQERLSRSNPTFQYSFGYFGTNPQWNERNHPTMEFTLQ